MNRRCLALPALAAVALLVLSCPRAVLGKEPADVLAEKGLTRQGGVYVLPGETELNQATADVRAAKQKLDAEEKTRKKLDDEINRIKSFVANVDFEKKRLTEQLPTARNRSDQEKIIKQIKEIEAEAERAALAKAEREAQIRKIGESTKSEYVTKVVEAAALAEKVADEYKALSEDAAVKAAIDQLNAAAKSPAAKVKLGPSPQFTASAAQVKRARGDVNSTVIRITAEFNVPKIEVTLNDKLTRTFTLDSGAAVVTLPGDLADELGLIPTDQHETVKLSLADGRVVEGKKMTLKSVRTGIFTVVDVECVVMNKSLVAVTPLLGGSYLNNFVYKVDTEAGELHLAQIAGNPRVKVGNAPVGVGGAPRKETPTTPPGEAPRTPPGTPAKPPEKAPEKAPEKPSKPGNPFPDADPLLRLNPAPPPLAFAQAQTPKPPPAGKSAPGGAPAAPVAPPTGKADAKKVVAYLESEYKRKLEHADWRTRALAVISLARLPHPEVTDKLFDVMDRDKHDVVRLLAWQAILSRAASIDAKQHTKWINSTCTLVEKGAVKGGLRPIALDVLATAPVNTRSRKAFARFAMETNGWETSDIPTIRALGRTLAAWKSSSICKSLINDMGNQNLAYRYEYILQMAGFKVPAARERLSPEVFNAQSPNRVHVSSEQLWAEVQDDYAQYLIKNSREWNEPKRFEGEPWKQLRPGFVPAPVTLEQLEANDALWRADLELGNANLKSFEVCFVVDATGSMLAAHQWLSRDILKAMAALGTIALEPRVGVTFYRDQGEEFVVKSLPLTHRGEQIVQFVTETGAVGGGDVAEAVLAGLTESIGANRWNSGTGGKVIVLVGDAPPHPNEVDQCVNLAKQAKEKGFRIYAAKVTTHYGANDLTSFETIAQAGGGTSAGIVFGRVGNNSYLDQKGKEIPLKTIPRPEAQLNMAPSPSEEHPAEQILTDIIADVINPQYRDRLQPLVRTLLAYCEQPSPPEERKPFPANTPSLKEGNLRPQDK